ncbi:hypothetical protein MU1_00020 [Paenibacillus glycanilyticus]|uniref:DUF4083 domain-containing protein n=1 Tax=Paenibacillus glycanilyticus TaxID=126569 RepID=A0ABQ6G8R6_9BACL|nr:hypothetical protein MU1_00020 [Paenibacillus glycanilyticus]
MEILIFIAVIIGLVGTLGYQNFMIRKMDKIETILREIRDKT